MLFNLMLPLAFRIQLSHELGIELQRVVSLSPFTTTLKYCLDYRLNQNNTLLKRFVWTYGSFNFKSWIYIHDFSHILIESLLLFLPHFIIAYYFNYVGISYFDWISSIILFSLYLRWLLFQLCRQLIFGLDIFNWISLWINLISIENL